MPNKCISILYSLLAPFFKSVINVSVHVFFCNCMCIILNETHRFCLQYSVPEKLVANYIYYSFPFPQTNQGIERSEIKIWDTVQKNCKHTMQYHLSAVTSMAFSQDDRLLLSLGHYQDPSLVRKLSNYRFAPRFILLRLSHITVHLCSAFGISILET